MKYSTRPTYSNAEVDQRVVQHLAKMTLLKSKMISELPDHRELLDKIRLYGLQSI